ncbi:MAG: DUF2270 domain-containing protein [Acidobacteriota bacterium]
MTDEGSDTVSGAARFEDYPLTRQEYLSVMVHFYRGEVARSTVWRERLDATTNWAVLTTAAMLSFAFSSAERPHFLLLLSNLIIFAYLIIEARRYRYFEVYRARVRMLEENFLLPIITRQLESPMETWRERVAQDLDLPKYKTTVWQAVGFRLRRNYGFIFAIMLSSWIIKLLIHPTVASSFAEVWERMALGHIPPSIIFGGGVFFYVCLLTLLWLGRQIHGPDPADEVAGLERNLKEWKL